MLSDILSPIIYIKNTIFATGDKGGSIYLINNYWHHVTTSQGHSGQTKQPNSIFQILHAD